MVTVRMNMGIVGVLVYVFDQLAVWLIAFMVVEMTLLVARSWLLSDSAWCSFCLDSISLMLLPRLKRVISC